MTPMMRPWGRKCIDKRNLGGTSIDAAAKEVQHGDYTNEEISCAVFLAREDFGRWVGKLAFSVSGLAGETAY